MVPLDELKEHQTGSRMRRNLVVGTLALALVAVALYFLFQPVEKPTGPTRLPEFDLPLLRGNGTLSSADLRGEPTVLNYFASWCPPCREEAPLLEETYREYRDQGVRFVGVNMEDTEEAAREFVDEFGITYPVIKDYDKTLARELGVTIGLPQTFFVTPEGLISSQVSGEQVGGGGGPTVSLGAIERTELIEQIERLLASE